MYRYQLVSNIGTREEQQDRFVHGEHNGEYLFGVLDGHGYSQVVDFVKSSLVQAFFDHRGQANDLSKVPEIFNHTFLSLNQSIINNDLSGGTTASLVYIDKDDNKWLGYVGDSPVFAFIDGRLELLMKSDHNVKNIKENGEFERLMRYSNREDILAFLANGRLGESNLTRALGDIDSMDWGVTYVPQIVQLGKIPTRFVLCSDGIHDLFTISQFQQLLNHTSPNQFPYKFNEIISEKIQSQLEQNKEACIDNLSVMLVDKNL